MVLHTEQKVNYKHKDNRNGFQQMFQGREAEIRAIRGNNVHENVGRYQEGGTSLLLYGLLIAQSDFEHSVKDNTGLGRWTVMTFRGFGGITTRVVCGYIPCYQKKAGRSSYQ